MSFLAAKPPVPPPTAAQNQATTTTVADQAAENLRARARRAASGRSGTILTNPLGPSNVPTGTVAAKTLLGS